MTDEQVTRRERLGQLERQGEFLIADIAKRWSAGEPVTAQLRTLSDVNATARALRARVTDEYMASKRRHAGRPAPRRRLAVVRTAEETGGGAPC